MGVGSSSVVMVEYTLIVALTKVDMVDSASGKLVSQELIIAENILHTYKERGVIHVRS